MYFTEQNKHTVQNPPYHNQYGLLSPPPYGLLSYLYRISHLRNGFVQFFEYFEMSLASSSKSNMLRPVCAVSSVSIVLQIILFRTIKRVSHGSVFNTQEHLVAN